MMAITSQVFTMSLRGYGTCSNPLQQLKSPNCQRKVELGLSLDLFQSVTVLKQIPPTYCLNFKHLIVDSGRGKKTAININLRKKIKVDW